MTEVEFEGEATEAGRDLLTHADPTRLHSRKLLGDMLVRYGHLTAKGLEEALVEKEHSEKPLGQVLVDLGLITREILARALAEQYGLEYLDLGLVEIDRQTASLLPERMARRHHALPVKFLDEETVLVAVADPRDLLAHDDVRLALGVAMKVAVAEDDKLQRAISRAYLEPLQAHGTLSIVTEQESEVDGLDIRRNTAGMGPAVRLVNEVIGHALDHGASDIHFEPGDENLVVRLRVDGVTRNLTTVPKAIQAPVIVRLKVMGGVDIVQRRAPQDGRVAIRAAGQSIDLRMAVIPTTHGERVALRILRRAVDGGVGLAALGMDAKTEATFRRAIAQPYGAIITCGPTGSGKTTTLYAGLEMLNEEGRVLLTIEDPVEYQMSGVGQVEVDPLAGLTFASGLRTILRSDPDVMLVGEVRDEETARIAMQAATTGHLVLTTLHTDGAANSIIRLKDLGVEPGLLATSINCIIAQRLARRLCLNCREPYTPTEAQRVEFGLAHQGEDLRLYRARGCEECFDTGFRGRVALYEAMPMTARIRSLIDASTDVISAAAVEEGMTTLHDSGIDRCLDGTTTLEEIRRVTGDKL